MKFVIVDGQDQIIGYKEREDINSEDIYRVSALWITNTNKDILLAQRSLNKINDPGKWGPAVAGTNEKGESYILNILKEAKEEIGIKIVNPELSIKEKVVGEHNHFTQWFKLVLDIPLESLTINYDEINKVKWFSPEELQRKIKKNPNIFLKNFERYFKLFS